ncbi:MAG TPA: ferric reductase-like transmembrane domain-containing protein, partial [Candidatus Paceibacterota bacterium]|nr:ferric reductase-like transmembrane domain-containing protein [Candidatus Paceibacterota bacterium]
MKGMKLGWPIIIVASVIPIVLWALAYPLETRFVGAAWQTTFRLVTTSIGQMLGLAGMAMFALNLALAARVRWMEDLFGGMNKVYIAHHILGGLAFVLLLFHPLFLALKFLLSGGSGAIQFFFFSSDPAVNYGIIALGLMILFLVLTFFVKLPYHIWKFTHKFLGAAFFFASLHVLLIASDVTMVKALKYYMFTLVVIGFAAIIYRTILGTLVVPRREYVVESVACVNDTITEVRLKHKEGTQMRFQPGQFI